jgi:hypothetical protein
MNTLDLDAVRQYVNENIQYFPLPKKSSSVIFWRDWRSLSLVRRLEATSPLRKAESWSSLAGVHTMWFPSSQDRIGEIVRSIERWPKTYATQ